VPDTREEYGPPPPPSAADAPPRPAAAPSSGTAKQEAPAAPAAAATPYDDFEARQAEREKAGKGFSIDIPKSSRIAYVHNNPGNL
jgi:hypothetical protein